MSSALPKLRVRQSIAALGKKGDNLDWYGKAVAVLKARPLSDPTGWRYLAAVHGYPGHANDPFRQAGEKLPSKADQGKFWDQCQHQTWFFLSWHRGYLACFEDIVAAAVVQAGGPAGWTLPYWNYSDTAAGARRLPAAFLNQLDSKGKPNALWVDGRNMTSTADSLPATHVNLGALTHAPFAGTSAGGSPGFGGPQTGFSHFGGTNGLLENVPHNLIHVDVGGLMSDPNTAALDPIFWVHHANIDRLWEVWRSRNAAFVNPKQKAWLTGTSFQLHDASGKVVKFTSNQMQDASKVRHGYQYDDISDPLGASVSLPTAAVAGTPVVKTPPSPDLVAASASSLTLAHQAATMRVSFKPAAATLAASRAMAGPVRAFLNLENVTGSGIAGSYDVYINVPPASGGTAVPAPPLLAGHLSTFGVDKASGRKAAHGGGITTVIEITPLLEQLRGERQWDGQHVDVSFVPYQTGAARSAPGAGKLTVGRISVYFG